MKSGFALAPLAAVLALAVAGQEPAEGFRQMWIKELKDKRPPARKPAAAGAVYRPVKPVSTGSATAPVTPLKGAEGKRTSPANSQNDTVLGVTLYRLRKAGAIDDPNSRLLVIEEESGAQELVPERVDLDTLLAKGDRVRLSIEVPRAGYLYVIDRELYVDGTTSEPYLIYPNYLTRPGDNLLAAGRVIEIPDSRDNPNHFRVRPTRPDTVSELFSILVTPEPLAANLKAGKRPLKLAEETYKEWETKFGVEAERFVLEGSAGKAWTSQEKLAGAGSAILTQDDALPQTLFKVNYELGKAVLVRVPVKVRQ